MFNYLTEVSQKFNSVEKHRRIPPARDILAGSNMNDLHGQI